MRLFRIISQIAQNKRFANFSFDLITLYRRTIGISRLMSIWENGENDAPKKLYNIYVTAILFGMDC